MVGAGGKISTGGPEEDSSTGADAATKHGSNSIVNQTMPRGGSGTR